GYVQNQQKIELRKRQMCIQDRPNNNYAQDLQSYSGKVCNTTYKAPIERSEGFF
nr:hypothetical protein [Clostridioides difficile]